jgi:hypothetical protein
MKYLEHPKQLVKGCAGESNKQTADPYGLSTNTFFRHDLLTFRSETLIVKPECFNHCLI